MTAGSGVGGVKSGFLLQAQRRSKSTRSIGLDVCRAKSYIEFMTYTPLALANTFVARHGATDTLDHMKLQKLAFYTYGWWLAYNDTPLLTEKPQVWRYGPVFGSLYSALRPFGSQAIRQPVSGPNTAPPIVSAGDALTHQWIDWVWNRYGHLNALQLSDMTHEVGSPWQTEAAARQYKVPQRHAIPDGTTRDYFKGLAASLS
jgi:uncharacterized phage-associated protein